MSSFNGFAPKVFALTFIAQLCAMPVVADSKGTGGFIFIGSDSGSLHLRSKHQVHRHYAAPKVYQRKNKPSVHGHKSSATGIEYTGKPKAHYHKGHRYKAKSKRCYHKPAKRYHYSVHSPFNRLSSPYYIPQNYGIRRR
ncbi:MULTISPECIES: hypothetical protein [unclassified Ruegeria]|uniref:hypothetical protein n=1 Tax=unclassified Ruegeria TaxID=2625375 RepID=UPI001488F4CA|nr:MULTISPECIES: hypothetical protein [unclassified Ruegeria]